jgi:hypothetical protein
MLSVIRLFVLLLMSAVVECFETRLSPNVSTGPCTVVEIESASVPASTAWFFLRSGSADAFEGQWFQRTNESIRSPFQQFSFKATPASSFVVEAWSDRNDLGDGISAKLLATSTSMAFISDDKGFSKSLEFDNFRVVGAPDGWVKVSAKPTNLTAYAMAKLVTWYGYRPKPTAGTDLAEFSLDTHLLADQSSTRYFPNPANGVSTNFSVSCPGTYFIGIYGAWNGEYGYASPKPEIGVKTGAFPLVNRSPSSTGRKFQPMAIVVPFENGTHPTLPANFAGPVHVTKAIPGDWRLALLVNKITIFNGGTVNIRGVAGPAYPNGYAFAPKVVEVELPIGVTIVPPNSTVTPNRGYQSVQNVTNEPTGGSGEEMR